MIASIVTSRWLVLHRTGRLTVRNCRFDSDGLESPTSISHASWVSSMSYHRPRMEVLRGAVAI